MSAARDFWSRRRARVAAEAARPPANRPVPGEARSDADILADLGLPDPTTLLRGDDFSAFMAREVPEHLRRLALRRLWGMSPVLANVDGLVDYGEDFTDAACAVKSLRTAYRVGRGMAAHLEELARIAESSGETAEDVTDAGDDDAAPSDLPAEDALPMEDAAEVLAAAPQETAAEVSAPRRRMRFDFDADQRREAGA